MREFEKYRQVKKEAGATGVFLLVLILFWIAAGFGLYAYGPRAEVFHLPLWALFGTVGVWVFAIVGVRVLVAAVFRDMPLEPEDAPSAAGGASRRAARGAGGAARAVGSDSARVADGAGSDSSGRGGAS